LNPVNLIIRGVLDKTQNQTVLRNFQNVWTKK